MKKFLPAIFLLLVITISSSAQEFSFKNYSAANTPAGIFILDTYQDSKGFIWFSSYSTGLSRFNSLEFEKFSKEEGLLSNTINSITEDFETNTIWCASEKGINIIKNNSVQNTILLKDSVIYDLLSDTRDSSIWIAAKAGLFHYQNGEFTFVKTPNSTKVTNSANKLLQNPVNKAIILQTQTQILEYQNGKFENLAQKTGIDNGKIELIDNSGGYWFSVKKGLKRYLNGEITEYTTDTGLSFNVIQGIAEDKFGDFWVALDIGGVDLLKIKDGNTSITNLSTENGLPNTRVYSSFVDREGNLWFVTDAGLSKLSDQKFITYNVQNGLPNNYVNDIFEDSQDRTWIATAGGGVSVLGTDINYTDTNGLFSRYVLAVTEDKNHTIWFGTWGGYISCLEGNNLYQIKDTALMQTDKVYSFAENPDENLMYIGIVVGGVGVVRNKKLEKVYRKKDGLIHDNVICLLYDSQKRLWVGTRNGLSILENDEFYTPTNYEFLKSTNVSEIIEDEKGQIWLATDEGLVRFSQDLKEAKVFDQNEGLLNKQISGVLIDAQDNIWAANGGLSKLEIQGNSLKVENFTDKNGLVSSMLVVHSTFADKQGNLWFGTALGLSKYLPARHTTSDIPPLVYLKSAISGDSTLSQGTVLDYESNNINFQYYGIWFKDEIPLEYSHILEPYESSWSSNSEFTQSQYTNLNPGKYTFRVKATNSAAQESKEYAFSFEIKRPYWLMWQFWLPILLILAISPYLASRWRMKKIKEKNEELERAVLERTAELYQHQEEIQAIADNLQVANEEITKKKNQIEKSHKNTQSSINYASRIQTAMMPKQQIFNRYFEDSFIYYKPRDIVSGDFFWAKETDTHFLFAVSDCTGHGVPGAFVSMLGISQLNDITMRSDISSPSKALDELRKRIKSVLGQTGRVGQQKDGMDIALCSYHLESSTLEFAGARNPLYLIRDGELTIYKADKMPVGVFIKEKPFTNNKLQVQKGDMLYVFSDGYYDQFGGEKNEKFMVKRFRELLLSITKENLEIQQKIIDDTFSKWQGELSQLDDVLILGIRV